MKLSFFYGIRFSDWIRVLKDNRFSVHPFYWHRAAWISFLSLHNSWLHRKEAKIKADTDPVAPIFVLGHWRSGTTHLHNLLDRDPKFATPTTYQVAYPGSFLRSEERYQKFLAKMVPEKRPQDNMAMAIDTPNEDEIALAAMGLPTPYLSCHFPNRDAHFRKYLSLRDAGTKDVELWKNRYREYLRRLVVKHGHDKTLILKSPPHTARIPLLLEMFPEAKFVHIHRDPFRTYQSTVHLHESWNGKMAALQRFKPDAETISDSVIDFYRDLYRCYLEDKDFIPEGNLHTVRFDDLETDPIATLRSLYSHLGINSFPSDELQSYLRERSIRNYQKNRYEPLDTRTKHRIRSEWDFAFEAFGYGA